MKFLTYLMKQIVTPTNPASGYNKLYFKADGKLYKLNNAGVETEVGGGTWYSDSTIAGTITGTINGVNTAFVLSNSPTSPQSVILAYNGQLLDYGYDYTISGKNITMTLIPISGKLTARYYVT